MPVDDWERIQSLFLSAADLPPGEQARVLDEACEGDAELREEVESLLASDRRQGSRIASAVGHEVVLLCEGPNLTGCRLGAYRVVTEIGRGGMGTVYLATRDDDQYSKQVAIKVVKRGMDTAEVLGRFRRERQILANLDHPFIARLLDGGTTPDGRPYFAMEHVEGRPIDVYCRERSLDVGSRVRLFLRVCEAVSYAHRNLVVHRDLKPGNILVTAEGVPKLLDFGVAKLLAGDHEADFTITAVSVGPLTPEYSSPEQILGQPITTATDVYALGTILYELLTGSRAHKITTSTASEIERIVCHTEVPRARSIAPGLHSDLDNILLLAMRKEQDRRYHSVDHLAEDLRRHLDGLPVAARGDSLAYRAQKFLRRNALPVTALAAVLVSVLGGAVTALHQTRVAQGETALRVKERDRAEEQRRAAEREHATAERERASAIAERNRAHAESKEAETQRNRAEQRLHDLVEVANQSLYGLDQALARQGGGTGARRLVVESTLAYLDRLAADESQDRGLSMAIATGYLKMGDVLGRPRMPNLGNPAGALASYRKAWTLSDKIRKQHDSVESTLLWLHIGERIAVLELENVNHAASLTTLKRVLPVAQRLSLGNPENREAASHLAEVYQDLSDVEFSLDSAQGFVDGKKAIAITEQLLKRYPGDERLLDSVSSGYSQLANGLAVIGDRRGAIAYARDSLLMREERMRLHPDDVLLRRDLMLSCTRVGDLSGGAFSPGDIGEEGDGYTYYKRAADLAEGIAKADPSNIGAQDDYAIVLVRLGASMVSPAALKESSGILDRAIAMLHNSLHLNPKTRINRITLLIAYETMARRLEQSGLLEEALGHARDEWKGASALAVEHPDYRPARHRAMSGASISSRLLARLGRREEALEMARHMSDMANAETTFWKPFFIAYAWVSAGDAHAILAPGSPDPSADWRTAHDAFQHSLGGWDQVASRNGPYNAVRVRAYVQTRLLETEAMLRGDSAEPKGPSR
jgi:tetratricopeptide (TPR) repeat protein